MSPIDGTYEMLWDCSSCGTRGLLGRTHRQCPNCGATQDPAKRYFPPPGQEQEIVNHTFDGVDKVCSACGTANGAASSFCRNCAAPLEGAKAVGLVGADPKPPQGPKALSSVRGSGFMRGCVIAVVVAIVFLLIFVFWKKESAAIVEGHRWARTIAVESLGPVVEEAWCDSMPPDARGISRRREQRSTRQIPDGENCTTRNVDNGDGTFSKVTDCVPKYRDEPVYDDKCSYTVDRWRQIREASAGGQGLTPAPVWPETRLVRSGQCIGCEREGARSEQYVLELKTEETSFPCKVNESIWRSYSDGARVKIKVRAIGGAPDCDSIQPQG